MRRAAHESGGTRAKRRRKSRRRKRRQKRVYAIAAGLSWMQALQVTRRRDGGRSYRKFRYDSETGRAVIA